MRAVLLLTMLCVAAVSQAREWRPFVGVGGVLTQPLFRPEGWPFYGGFEWQTAHAEAMYFEAGMTFSRHEFYAAYRATNMPADRWSSGSWGWRQDWIDHDEGESYWSDRRFTLGARERIGHGRALLVVGGGLDVGRFVYGYSRHFQRTYYSVYTDSLGHQQLEEVYRTPKSVSGETWKSALNLGAAAEFGVMYALRPELEFVILSRIHGDVARFGDNWLGGSIDAYDIITPTLIAEIRVKPLVFGRSPTVRDRQ
ncbi:hypothetical protein HZB60_11645 [candidate division KSB1 bacterium]|nr:hypothetical protein [candidate division KSB1 bacterium]